MITFNDVIPVLNLSVFNVRRIALDPAGNRGVIAIHTSLSQHLLQLRVADAVFAVPANRPQDDVTLKMPAFEWFHVLLRQQKVTMSLSHPDFCNRDGKTLKPWSVLVDHIWTPRVLLVRYGLRPYIRRHSR